MRATAQCSVALAVLATAGALSFARVAWSGESEPLPEGALPTDIPVVKLSRSKLTDGKAQAVRLLVETSLTPSTSDARRAIAQGGAYFGEGKTRLETHDQLIAVETGLLLFVGKKKFCRVEVGD